MNGFWGADTEALRTMGTVCSRRAEALADLETLLTSTIDNIEWIGEDADRFRADWSGIVRPLPAGPGGRTAPARAPPRPARR
ncbi:hypothetical protein H3H54_02295 [Brachybacterium sp. Z12]|uniref:hypothetical protein n=1 Tax=Brachybacterium sp. Z12 TaxID=2759167 RepID=UPI00185FE579|nr:hypothetical protein [Brachybacterium sp. Z12]QNN82760.1 hypothetical protein H3H54_02295 [Brachybacterium sp. Z12]